MFAAYLTFQIQSLVKLLSSKLFGTLNEKFQELLSSRLTILLPMVKHFSVTEIRGKLVFFKSRKAS